MERRARAESWRSGFLTLNLGCKSCLLLKQVALGTHLSFAIFHPERSQNRHPLTDIPPHPLFFLASLEEQNTMTLMQKDVTLHDQEVKYRFEQQRDGAGKSPLYDFTSTRKEVTTHTLWGFAYSYTYAQALQAHGTNYILWMNSGQPNGMLILKFCPHRKPLHLMHMPVSPGLIPVGAYM